jgi:hypothetical protein
MFPKRLYSSLLKSSLTVHTQKTIGHHSSLVDSLGLFNDLKVIFPNHARTLSEYLISRLSPAFSHVPSHQIHRDLPRLPQVSPGNSSANVDMSVFNNFWQTAEEWRAIPGSLKFDLWVVLSSQKELGRDLICRLDSILVKLENESNGRYAEWRSSLEEIKFRTKYIYTIMLTVIYSIFIGDFLFQKPNSSPSTPRE